MERTGYHHGDLREALIRATDEILAERGLEGFTLREAARRAGVSPAAPAHHFGSSAGLLTEVAILGFEELARHITIDPAAPPLSPAERLKVQGIGYVRFALAFPGRFHLMFRHDLLVADDERLLAAGGAAKDALAGTIDALRPQSEDQPSDAAVHPLLLGLWSTVHGFAHLVLDGKFSRIEGKKMPDHVLNDVLPAVLDALLPKT
ncbi:MAG: TetR/AcrR family transcriptional regulator [Shinella sp.]|nr:TetR/AcrR family transcriptional regulator [Shinella sp.]